MDTIQGDFVEGNELLQRRAVLYFVLPLNHLALNDITLAFVFSLNPEETIAASAVHFGLERATDEGAAIAAAP